VGPHQSVPRACVHPQYQCEPPGNVYRVKDGYITLECITPEMWEGFARAMERQDLLEDPRYRDSASRHQNAATLDREIDRWMARRTVGEVLTVLHRHSVPAGPVLDIPALVKNPQFLANHIVTQVTHPTAGQVPLLAPPIGMTGDAGPRRGRPPRLGEHTEEVLAEWLALPPSQIASLCAAEVVQAGR